MASDLLKKRPFDMVFTRRRKRSSSTATEDPVFVRPGFTLLLPPPLMASDLLKKRSFDKVFTRRRKRSSSTATEDPVFVRPGLRRDEVSKHRSCKVHMLSYKYGPKATRKEAEQIEVDYGTAFCFFNDIPHGLRSRKSKPVDQPVPLLATETSTDPNQVTDMSPIPLQAIDRSSDPISFQATNMSSSNLSDHLESLWRSFPADKLVHYTYLECLWFGAYRKESQTQRTKILSWIKKKNIFSRNYVFVPICCWSHWNLLILCHFGERLDSDDKRPFMVLLDSLHMAGPMRLERDIRKFVLDIYNAAGISDHRRVSKIPLHVPKVPQQRNKECGFFSLYFIKKFIETVPETISARDVSFMNKNWFGREEFDKFCIALEKESKERTQLEATTSEESDSGGDVVEIIKACSASN